MLNQTARRTFFYGLFKYSLVLGLAGAWWFTDSDYFNNDFNSRPDMNQMRIMTPVPDHERKVFEMYGDTYFGKEWEDKPQSWQKRLQNYLFPSTLYNPSEAHYLPFYDYRRGFYPGDDTSYYH